MDNLDLDINNYSIKDIEKFFRFSSKTKYNAKDIELREYEIREQLLSSGHINKRFKRDLIQFLTLAKNWLIYVKCNPTNNQPTTIPNNYKLDNLDTPISKEPLSRTEELIKRDDTTFVRSQNSDYFPGVMNQLSTRVITKCLNIDTRFRDNIYNSHCADFTINLPIKFNKVVSMQLASIEIPITFYGISQGYGNNYLYIKLVYNSLDISGSSISEERTFIIPDGNYNAIDFIDKINELFAINSGNNNNNNQVNMFSFLEFTIDINNNNSGSGKAKLTTTGAYANYITEIIMDFTKDINGNPDNTEITTKIGWNLGFIKHRYTGSTSYTSDTILEPSGIRYIYLAIDDFNNSANNHFISIFNKSILSPNILARISIKGSYFALLMENDYNVISEPRTYFGPVDIQKLRVRLFDEHGRILQMNNANYSFCLNLKMLYDL